MVAVADSNLRYLLTRDGDGTEREELFDASEDAAEQIDLVDDRPELASRMREIAVDYLDRSQPAYGVDTPTIELDEMERAQLRALGYAVP